MLSVFAILEGLSTWCTTDVIYKGAYAAALFYYMSCLLEVNGGSLEIL